MLLRLLCSFEQVHTHALLNLSDGYHAFLSKLLWDMSFNRMCTHVLLVSSHVAVKVACDTVFSAFPDCVEDHRPHGVVALLDPIPSVVGPPGFRLGEGVGVRRPEVAFAGTSEDTVDRRGVAVDVVVATFWRAILAIVVPKFNMTIDWSCRGRASLPCWLGVIGCFPLEISSVLALRA